MFSRLFVVLFCLISAACATVGGWQPTVDPYNDQNAGRISYDLEQCRQLASQASGGGTAKETAIGAGVGGLIGAAAGAAIGAAAGNPAIGAAVGAAAGGFGGAGKQGFQSEDHYKSSYAQCMQLRGHNVIR